MALRPNGRYMTTSTYKGFGVAPGLDARLKSNGDSRNRFVSSVFVKTASTPDGYGMNAVVPPLKAGSMSALVQIETLEGSLELLSGKILEGTFTGELAGSGSLSLTVSLASNTLIISLDSGTSSLALTLGLNGSGTISLNGGTSNLAMIVPFDGTGVVASLTGVSDLKGRLALSGEWTPFTELSPENLARAVWDALASQYNEAGTMGAKLNTASSGGVDMNELAQAVWEYATRTLTSGGGGGDPWSDPRALTVAKFLGLK